MLSDGITNGTIPSWIPRNITKYKGEKVQVKLLCGADLLESFATPKLWNEHDVKYIIRQCICQMCIDDCFVGNIFFIGIIPD